MSVLVCMLYVCSSLWVIYVYVLIGMDAKENILLVSVYMCLRMCIRSMHVCMTVCMSFLVVLYSLCVHVYGGTHWHV